MFHDAAVAFALGIGLPVSTANLRTYMNGVALSWNPGTTYEYSNYGYMLLGRVIEAVTGLGYEEYAEDSVFESIGVLTLCIWGRTHWPNAFRARSTTTRVSKAQPCWTTREIWFPLSTVR